MGICCLFGMSYRDIDDSLHDDHNAYANVHFIETIDNWEATLSQEIKENKLVVANFGASWCNPCLNVAPLFVELATKHPSMLFLNVDVDELPELCTSWDIKATPTFIFLKNGRHVDTLVGGNEIELQKKIASMSHN